MKKSIVFGVLILVILSILSLMGYERPDDRFSSSTHLEYVRESLRGGPMEPNEYFLLPERCAGCHGYDSLRIANINAAGDDINLVDDWSTSMMALSAKDPLWLAKVRHESLVNPGHATELQNLCTKCHAPMGNYKAHFLGHPDYTLADVATDSLGRAGVACMGCHSIGTDGLGSRFTGDIPYDTSAVAYGPFVAPMAGPMQLYVGLTPTHSLHVSESRMCSPCHTLISNTVDLAGNPTGGSFAEQATYHEWLNSEFPRQEKPCQSCHMPQVEEAVKIAVGYTALPGRSPFNQHVFAGANAFMLQLMKNNKDSLGIMARDTDFNQTLSAVNTMLRQNTLDLNARFDKLFNDSIFIDIELVNKAGHKFPTGYPSRRAILQCIVTKANGDTLFASGKIKSDGELLFPELPFEPHHDIINSPFQNQVYEMVMADVLGNRTTVLERAASSLKDNRLVPKGFSNSFYTYDTCRIVGVATSDLDFNKVAGLEGSGRDIVHYHVPLLGYSGTVNVYTQVYYAAVPPSWLTEMFSFTTFEIDRFKAMYESADKQPKLVASDTISDIVIPNSIKQVNDDLLQIYPNPVQNGLLQIFGAFTLLKEMDIFDIDGHIVKHFENIQIGNTPLQIKLDELHGSYFIRFNIGDKQLIKKIIILAE